MGITTAQLATRTGPPAREGHCARPASRQARRRSPRHTHSHTCQRDLCPPIRLGSARVRYPSGSFSYLSRSPRSGRLVVVRLGSFENGTQQGAANEMSLSSSTVSVSSSHAACNGLVGRLVRPDQARPTAGACEPVSRLDAWCVCVCVCVRFGPTMNVWPPLH